MFELPVSEAIYRLADPGELAIDAGANIGQMTSLMAIRVGSTGRVLSFEPHPVTFDELSANVNRWVSALGTASIRSYRLALSDKPGSGVLAEPGDDSLSRGRSSLGPNDEPVGPKYMVDLCPLGEFVAERERIGVLKLDVEGHECQVLRGAETALQRQGIRDIIFEEFRPYPTETTALLESAGYQLFSIGQNFWGLVLNPPSVLHLTRSDYSPTYLATSDPTRASRRLEKRGWAVLRSASRRRRK
jgi:FkbM family methyltransferase